MTRRGFIPRAGLCVGITLLATLALPARAGPSSGTEPAPSGAVGDELAVAGLHARVTIRRDARGIPALQASDEHDLFFAQGFVTAGDRLWQMDLLRRTARGELAEILGEEVLEQDAQMRVVGFGALADGLVERVSPRMRAALAAYADGVNAQIATRGDDGLPVEFGLLGYKPKPWRSGDSLVIGKLFALNLSFSWPTDVLRAALASLPPDRRAALFPEESPLDVVLLGGEERRKEGKEKAPPHATQPPRTSSATPIPDRALARARQIQRSVRSALNRAGLYASAGAASNTWVVAGSRSETGKPLLANDPHLEGSAPSLWYLAHLDAPGFHVEGVTTPGVIGILLGHNERIAWGVTNLMADVQDLYVERFDASGSYAAPGGARAAQTRKERILVRGDQQETRTVDREVVVTRHGPVVLETGKGRYALRWTALDPDASEVAVFFDLDRAADWKEFTAALEKFAGPPLNFVYADTKGHIGYYAAGRIPVRRSGDGTEPYPGETDAHEWSGYVRFRELPHLFDPPAGAIVTANNRVVGRGYPHLITRAWGVPYRARRISDLLAAKPKLSADDFEAIQADTYSFAQAIFTRAVLEVAKSQDGSKPEWGAMIKLFDGWDGRASADSRVLPLAAAMRRVFADKVFEAALGAERAKAYSWPNRDTVIDTLVTARPVEWLPKEYPTYADFLLACWNDARTELAGSAGADDTQWTWGRVVPPIRFSHPLEQLPGAGSRFAIAPLPEFTDGSGETVNAGVYVSMRFIADLSDWDRSRQGIALGESGDPSSPHWADQLSSWRAVKTPAFPFSSAAVARATVQTLILAPAHPPAKSP